MPEISSDHVTSGIFFAVVGASGAGKDTILSGSRHVLIRERRFLFPQRFITRPQDAGGEDHLAIEEKTFEHIQQADGFCLSWSAHGLQYGIARGVTGDLQRGHHVVCNISRATISAAKVKFDHVEVIELTASDEVLAKRLKQRGRETASAISARRSRNAGDWKKNLTVYTISNNGNPENAVADFVNLLLSLSGQSVQPT